MSLFERIKNIRRNNLREEKMKFPGGTGDIGFTAPKRQEKVQKRLTRADKLGTPDPFDPDYDKKVKKIDGRTKTGKAFQTPKKSDLKKLAKKPGGYRAPEGTFGQGITQGQANVKGMERRAFKITKPSDVKLPQTFTDFSKKLRRYKSDVQDFKDKDIATMRTGKSSSKVKVSGANNLSRQDVGMAPPDKPKVTPTKGVKQAEVSKKIAKGNEAYNVARTNKVADLATKKQQSKLSQTAADLEKQTEKIDAAKQKLRSATGTKDVKKIRQLNVQGRKYRELTNLTKKAASGVGNPNAPVKYNKMTAGADFIKKNRKSNTKLVTKSASKKPVSFTIPGAKGPKNIKDVKLPKFGTGITKSGNISFAKDPTKLGGMKLNKTTQAIVKRETSRALRRPENVKFAVAAAKRKGFARGATRLVGKLGPKGRIAAAGLSFVPTLLANPGVRNFVKNTALFGTAAAALGLAKPKQNVLKVGKGVTKTTNLPSKFQPKNAKNLSYVDAYGKKRKLGSGDVRFNFGLTGSKPGKKSGGMQYNKQDMARVKNIQKKYIDSYNASVKGNPFKKQIKYSVNKDGSYTVTPPKKK